MTSRMLSVIDLALNILSAGSAAFGGRAVKRESICNCHSPDSHSHWPVSQDEDTQDKETPDILVILRAYALWLANHLI